MSLEGRTIKILGPAGVLARSWERFEAREGQLDLAVAAARALENRTMAVVEAGTGTGKTLAYLVPIVLSGLRTIISTATKNLQEQIVAKDLPLLLGHLSARPKVCLVKGRLNYLCRWRFEQAAAKGGLEPWLVRKLAVWADQSETGDRAEVDFLPEEDPLWIRLTASSDQCLGQECTFFDRCFITHLRRRAGGAEVVVVNHHLFMADLALRQGGHGQVLPESEAVVFDEAHELEPAATSHFSVTVSNLRIADLAADLAQALGGAGPAAAERLDLATAKVFGAIRFKGERANLSAELLGPEVISAAAELAQNLDEAGEAALAGGQDQAEAQGLAARAEAIKDSLTMILHRLEPDYVYYAERLRRGMVLKAAPVEVAGLLQRTLFHQRRAFIFTSATLDPARFRSRLGLGAGVDELALASPFDFAGRSLLYVPSRMPPPGSAAFPGAVAEEMEELVKISQGRAFLLFTSRRNLEAVHSLLRPRLQWPVLKQGQAPRAKLIEDFLEHGPSVLMATASFWQGVDIPGPSLSLVAIDKLPFAPPDDPLVAARSERLQALGINPFAEYHLPEATLALRQGLGRLIRSFDDQGILAVLDIRLVEKAYGRTIMEHLPPSPLVRSLDQVREWAESRSGF